MSFLRDNELPVAVLRRRTDATALGFETTDELDCLKQLIGQDRAVRAVSFGLSVNSKGYNLFVVGDPGSGRTTYTLEEMHKKASEMPAPNDWVYVYNFDEAGEPIAIKMSAGRGKELAHEMTEMIEELKVKLGKAFENNQYEDNKAQLVKDFQESINDLMEELRAQAKERNFSVKRTPQGFVNLPLFLETDEQGNSVSREMQPDEFEKLPEEEQERLQLLSEEISQKTLEVLRQIRDGEKVLKDQIKDLESEICRNTIQPILAELKEAFDKDEGLDGWIDALTADIIENFGMFVAGSRDENAEVDFSRYEVNVFVSNDPNAGAPVIREMNPVYYNLVGKVEYESRQGYLYTDFRKIMPGALHRANGGFLLLEAEKVLRQFMSWDALKRVLLTKELMIENLSEHLGAVPVSSLRPQAIPIDVKVVIIGTYELYYLLNEYDPEFDKIFKIKADFESDMPRNSAFELKIACFIATFVDTEGKLPFHAEAVAEIIEWGAREVEDQNRMSTQFNKMSEILVESTAWARVDKASQVTRMHVRKAIEERLYRVNLIEERYLRAFETGVIRIDTDGAIVGQINGLTVITLEDHAFGHPVRITANVFTGQDGIVNIEREVKMTGPIHNKGLLTLSSFLGKKYAQHMPISVTARIAFEQTYSGIEGDSASSTELYCLLSALSGVPLRQDIAVTGSVDQFGNIQPIGGVNEKIEGFFSYCKVRGFTGSQGVMIPVQNVRHLMLSHDVLDAVEKGEFHVWTVATIDEGIEILTGIPAGVADAEGNYSDETIHGKVEHCLFDWIERAAKLKQEISKKYGDSDKDADHEGEEDFAE